MRFAFLKYKKARINFAKNFPNHFALKDWQQNIWEYDFSLCENDNNAAEYGLNSKTHAKEPACFNLEYFHILDCVPKEQFDGLLRGIKKFKKKHGGNSLIDRELREADYFSMFYSGEAFSLLTTMSIRKESCLYPYIAQIGFSVVNITDSFCCLCMTTVLNKDLKNSLIQFITSNVKSSRDVAGYENKKWFQFRNMGNSERPGTVIKPELLDEILTDICWKLTKEVDKFIPCMILAKHKVSLPFVPAFSTNIDANTFPDFWRSLDIRPEFCDFTEDYSGCITWGRQNSIFYIYGLHQNGDYLFSSILAHDIYRYLGRYLIAESVNNVLRRALVDLSKEMAALKGKTLSAG